MHQQNPRFAVAEIAPVSDTPRDYYERKAAGLCTRCGAPAAADAQLCEAHQLEARDIGRRSVARRRARRRDRGLCAYCGKIKSETYTCAGCAIRHSAIPSTTVHNTVDKPPPVWRAGTTESDASTLRYRGQGHRGAPTAAVLDEQDARQIAAEVERSRAGLDYAHGLPEALPKAQRKDAVRAALSRMALAGRFIAEMLERHGYKP